MNSSLINGCWYSDILDQPFPYRELQLHILYLSPDTAVASLFYTSLLRQTPIIPIDLSKIALIIILELPISDDNVIKLFLNTQGRGLD
jgi:hypothetical protein